MIKGCSHLTMPLPHFKYYKFDRERIGMAKNMDTSNINRSGIYDHKERTITYIDPKGKEPERVYSVEDIFLKFDGLDISVTWAVTTEGKPSAENEE